MLLALTEFDLSFASIHRQQESGEPEIEEFACSGIYHRAGGDRDHAASADPFARTSASPLLMEVKR